ncbi:uncharacterized protein CLAFUR5_07225 [Fulvia fulva]|uniref:Uncharacterized protein n=1 Tax=Passalora fulva TaxID=5499 RepID=A0A9Q8PB26_PASFU|nr:uncharacterized protein CLAFUR5_07225 [Fulvia fulva]UJO19205.1 hypothetical protein CLAFUR5_07225 [Fulvia fulva]WPV31016.1 hypothetical protein CLAFUW7_07089 [Fulvia fulva]
MKYAKQLRDTAIPEWRDKYLSYKHGKKHLKAIAKAIRTLPKEEGAEKETPRPSLRQTFSYLKGKGRPSTTTIPINENSPLQTRRTGPRDIPTATPDYGSALYSRSAPDALELPEPALQRVSTLKQVQSDDTANASDQQEEVAPQSGTRAQEHVAGVSSPALSADSHATDGATLHGEMTSQREARETLDTTKGDFFKFMDGELQKINHFYWDKEEEAKERLHLLQKQLNIMRALHQKDHDPNAEANGNGHGATQEDHRRDYALPTSNIPPYHAAKKKMKAALIEYYRGLELLKSYATTNQEAYRKLCKKYNKAVKDKVPATKYMEEKVNKAYFVESDEIDHIMKITEDLYALHFEHGHHKVAVNKLRAKSYKEGHYTGAISRSGALLGVGTVLAIQGLTQGAQRLFIEGDILRTQTAYLLQLYAGYFLMWLLAMLFILCCAVFRRYRVNFQNICDLEKRTTLDWKQMVEIPSWLWMIFGIIMYLNFEVMAGGYTMFVYWPVVLAGLTLLLLVWPFKMFYHHTRLWLAYSIWRLVTSGVVYTVEFRDFFLGDMFCSLTYALGNIELFFCLYAREWDQPAVCNSSHSRLMGFLAALPSIIRGLQCIRRFGNSHQWWPHLVNLGKYYFSTMMYMTLSFYRITKSSDWLVAFCVVSTINSLYCSVWDIYMDFSLGDLKARHKGLRGVLVYNNAVWIYYFIMVIDVILRFNWIAYAVYTEDVQHSSICSFLVAFSEVIRRGLWILIRVENEQATNIKIGKAHRVPPLPYKIPGEETPLPRMSEGDLEPDQQLDGVSEHSPTASVWTRVGDMLQNLGNRMRNAHVFDYHKKPASENEDEADGSQDSDDEDGDEHDD